ncbi:transcription antitermination factor NusB [Demequina sp.]|uniref:RsmB/NOP family class I SAM-dependent RNA methyltransferase n=1 Tax=Demequina sp. TaxID=2050685 RepID=UPI0025BCE71C|nr:transcription antitermination factor NusB [Demequina sp.]
MSDPQRRAALDCVLAVEVDGAYANLAMPGILRQARLGGREAAFATELAYGALRMSGLYDAVIAKAANRQPDSLDVTVRAVLWLGAHQALSMSTPTHAAVSETVELAKAAGAGRASGLVNAVMRRIVERDREAWLAVVAGGHGRAAVATRHSHPVWIVAELERSLAARGRADEVELLLAAHNTPAAVTLAARPGLADRNAVARATGGEPTALSPYGVTLGGGAPRGLADVDAGLVGVQDEGSQVVAAALTSDAARPSSPGERWLDACAGPGGKTALLGAIAARRGARVDAIELHEHRARLVEQNIRALPPGVVTVHVGDSTTWEGGPYDRILLDAPCTGLGALRRRPESRWRRTPEDLHDLTELQARLLRHAGRMLAPGGVIAYVTCSPVLSETTAIVAASGLRRLDARAGIADVTGTDVDQWGPDMDVQMWTHVHGTDSMYLAMLTVDGAR